MSEDRPESSNGSLSSENAAFAEQLLGEYRVKHESLQPLYQRARGLLRSFEHVDIAHVRREQNVLADRLVNRVLDQEAHASTK